MELGHVQSVTQLTEAIRDSLNGEFPDVWVSGEVSGLTRAQSGHLYLNLKDETAQLSAVIWRTAAQRLRFEPANGTQVLCRGYLDVYPQRGTYQLIINAVQPLGAGALQLAFRQLHDRLQAEGLFDVRHKKAMPLIPQRVVVITSPTGAAIHDFLQVVTRRWPHLDILIVPVKVQGSEAAGEIAAALRLCGGDFAFEPDVIVVTRGGGSIEDLWAFNEEQVVRAIFDCRVPVVSAVGHEIDVTLCDLVADMRALTPSEAGERLVPEISEIREFMSNCQTRIERSVRNQLKRSRELLVAVSSRAAMWQPLQIVRDKARQLDVLDGKLNWLAERNFDAVRQRLVHSLHVLKVSASGLIPQARLRLHQLAGNSAMGRPLTMVNQAGSKIKLLEQDLFALGANIIQSRSQPLPVFDGQLNAFDPTAVLRRGYSLTVDQRGKPLVSCQEIEMGDTIGTWLAKGRITSRVEATESNLTFTAHDKQAQ